MIFQKIILNNQGFVGEYQIENNYSIKLINAVNLSDESLNKEETQIFFRPSYDDLNKYFIQLKNNSFYIIITPDQEKEKKLLESYFKINLIDNLLASTDIRELLEVDFDDVEFMKLAKKFPGYKSLFCLVHLKGINYSYLINNWNPKQTTTIYQKEDFENLLNDYEYSKKYLAQEEVNPIFYEILFNELLGEESLSVKIFKKILDDKQDFNDDETEEVKKLKNKSWIIDYDEGNLKKLTFGYPIRD